MTNQLNENVEVKNVKGEKPVKNEMEAKSQTTDVLLAKDVTIEDIKKMDKFPCIVEKQISKKSKLVYKIKFFIGDGMNSIVKESLLTETFYNLLFRKHKSLNPGYAINTLTVRGRIFRGFYADGNIWVKVQIFIYEGKVMNIFLRGDELEMFKDMVKADEFMYVDKRIKVGANEFKKEYKKFTIIDSKEDLTEEEVDSYLESWESK